MLKNIRIGVKLGIAFGLVMLLLLAVVAVSINSLGVLHENLSIIVDDRYPKTVHANNAKENINITARAIRNAVLVDDPNQQAEELGRIELALAQINQSLGYLGDTVRSARGRQLLDDVTKARESYRIAQQQYLDLLAQDRRVEAIAMLTGDVRIQQAQYFAAVDALLGFQGELMVAPPLRPLNSIGAVVQLF